MTATWDGEITALPRAMVHKQILDEAAARPEATVAELAAEVSGASLHLVERVLEEYGDPGRSEPATLDDGTADAGPEGDDRNGERAAAEGEPAAAGDLTVAQRELLRLVYEHPTESQRELGARLGVSHTAVYHRVQSIPGLNWADRWAYVVDRFGGAEPTHAAEGEPDIDAAATPEPEGTEPGCTVASQPRLALKLVRACLESDALTDEELSLVLADLLEAPGDGIR